MTPKMQRQLRAVVVTGSLIIVSAWVAAAPAISSRWKDKEIVTDGHIIEWTEMSAFPEGVAVAAANDERSLYLAVASSDPQRRNQLLAAGLIVWIDALGGKKEAFGIRIPGAGLQRPEGQFSRDPGEAADVASREMVQPTITYVELWGPAKDDKRRIELSVDTGISAGARVDQGTLLYELKVPLAPPSESQPYGVGAKVEQSLGLGLQAPKLERPAIGERGTGMGSMGGRRGRGGVGDGGRGGVPGGMPGRAVGQLKEFKLWTTLTLARHPR